MTAPVMRVFLDTNVILDLLQRRDGYAHAARILQKAVDGHITIYTSSLSMVNVAYILRKHYRRESLYCLLNQLGDIISVLSVSSEAYLQALHSKAADFEDAVQLFSALEGNMDCIVTRNEKDFIKDKLPILNPSDFLLTM